MARNLDQLLQVRVHADFLKKIDAWRREQEDLPSRAEAVRRLCEQMLDTKNDQK
jgi:hypothetical protein